MAFVTPAFLLLALLGIPIVLLYMLRLRRREVTISSTLLWQRLLHDREANAPWQRLRRNLLLLLQLMILAALAIALARPYLAVPAVATGNVVVLLDGSASMRATDGDPTRFETAKAEVRELIGQLGGSHQMTLILVDAEPQVLAPATGDKSDLRQALDNAEPGYGTVDWPGAVALAAGAAQGYREVEIVFVSDGGLPEDLPPLPVETAFVPVGEASENLAFSALATRDGASGPQLLAQVRNYGLEEQQALVSVRVDGVLLDSRRLNIPPGEAINLAWELPQTAAVIQGSLIDATADYLPEDNIAWAVRQGGVQRRLLLVSDGNLFLERVFSVIPGIDMHRVEPGPAGTANGTYDLVVYDRTTPSDQLPAGDLLFIGPTESVADLFDVSGIFTETDTIRVADSPLLQFVPWSNIGIRAAASVDAPWASLLVDAEGGPLLLAGQHAGRRIAILPFSLSDSDLPLQVAFPILMANLTGWLVPGQVAPEAVTLRPGEAAALTLPVGTEEVTVQKPDGVQRTFMATGGSLIFGDTGLPGLYNIRLRDTEGERPAGSFAVNLFAGAESQLRPVRAFSMLAQTGDEARNTATGRAELWPWLAAVAIALLSLEWWLYHEQSRLLSGAPAGSKWTARFPGSDKGRYNTRP